MASLSFAVDIMPAEPPMFMAAVRCLTPRGDDVTLTDPAPQTEMRLLNDKGTAYVDPLPWDPLLGELGIDEADHDPTKEFIRVTSLLQFLPAEALRYWYGKMAAERAWDVAPIYRHWDMKEAMVADCKAAGDRVRDTAAVRGTAVHDLAEEGGNATNRALIELLEGRQHGDLLPEAAPYVAALQKFQQEYATIGAKIVWSEIAVYSHKLGVAGRGDLVMWIPGRGMWLVDIKTSNHILKKYRLQTWFYTNAEYGIVDSRRVKLPPIEGQVILWIKDDGTFEMVQQEEGVTHPYDVFMALQVIRDFETDSDKRAVWDSPLTWGVNTVRNAGNHLSFLTLAEVNLSASSAKKSAEKAFDEATFRKEYDTAELIWVDKQSRWVQQRLDMLATSMPAPGAGPWINEQFMAWYRSANLSMNGSTADMVTSAATTVQALDYFEAQATGMGAEIPFLNENDRPTHPGAALTVESYPADERADLAAKFRTGEYVFENLSPEFRASAIEALVAKRIAEAPKPDPLGQLVLRTPDGDKAIVPARRGFSVDPASFTRPDPAIVARSQELIERLNAMPLDLQQEIGAHGKEQGIPHLLLWQATNEQLDQVEAWIKASESVDGDRGKILKELIAEVVSPEAPESDRRMFTAALARWIGVPDLKRVDERTMTICQAIFLALRHTVVQLQIVDDKTLELKSLTSGSQLTEWFGGVSKARKVTKEACEALGLLGKGSSIEVVAAMPLCVAIAFSTLDEDRIAKRAQSIAVASEPVTLEPEPEVDLPVEAPILQLAAILAEPEPEHVDVTAVLLGLDERETDETVTPPVDDEPAPPQPESSVAALRISESPAKMTAQASSSVPETPTLKAILERRRIA